MEKEMVEVERHNEVGTGDYLVHIDLDGEHHKTNKMVNVSDDYSAMRILAKFMTFYFIHHFSSKVELRVVQYDSPLRQRVVKTVKLS